MKDLCNLWQISACAELQGRCSGLLELVHSLLCFLSCSDGKCFNKHVGQFSFYKKSLVDFSCLCLSWVSFGVWYLSSMSHVNVSCWRENLSGICASRVNISLRFNVCHRIWEIKKNFNHEWSSWKRTPLTQSFFMMIVAKGVKFCCSTRRKN